MDLAIYVLGGFISNFRYLVLQSALHHHWSSLSQQSGLFRLIDHIGWLLARLVCLMMCFSVCSSRLPLDLLYFMHESTFGHYGSLYHFMLARIILFNPPLYMGMAMLKATRKYFSVLFWCGTEVGAVHKSVQAGKSWHGQGHKSSSPLSRSSTINIGVCYVSHSTLALWHRYSSLLGHSTA